MKNFKKLLLILSALVALIPNAQSAETTLKQHEEGTPLSQYQLGLNYLLGRNGIERSSEKAAGIFKSLAEQNWSSAQHMLGNMYLSGKGVEQNDLLAYKWLSLASKSNLRLAESIQSKRKTLYIKLQNELSEEALDKVDNWITSWRPVNSTGSLLETQPEHALLKTQ